MVSWADRHVRPARAKIARSFPGPSRFWSFHPWIPLWWRRGSRRGPAVALVHAGGVRQHAAMTTARPDLLDNMITLPGPDDDDPELGPLFDLGDARGAAHAKTRVERTEPIDTGTIGHLDARATVADLASKWGGGTYRCAAIDRKGRIMEWSEHKIAGEPKFTNPIDKKRYAKKVREEFADEDAAGTSNGNGKADALSVLAMQQQAAEAQHRRELERLAAEAAAERERRRLEREEDDAREERRRKRDAEERDAELARQRQWMEDQRARDREFLATVAGQQKTQDPLTMMAGFAQIMSAMGVGQSAGGGGDFDDPETAAVARLPEIIREIREAAKEDREGKAGAAGAVPDADGGIKLVGPIAGKARTLIERLTAQGKTPEQIEAILSKTLDVLANARALPSSRNPDSRTKGAAARAAVAKAKPKAPAKKATPPAK